MELSLEERQWLLERRDALRRELDDLLKGDLHPPVDKTDRQAQLLLDLERIADQLGEEEDEPQRPETERRPILTD